MGKLVQMLVLIGLPIAWVHYGFNEQNIKAVLGALFVSILVFLVGWKIDQLENKS